MASSRAYVPSRALLRALSHPLPPRCPFARPVQSQFLRWKRTKAAQQDRDLKIENDTITPNIPGAPGLKLPTTVEEAEKLMGPLSDDVINDPDTPVVSWYEQDLDNPSRERFISRIATPEDRRKHNELIKMFDEDDRDPNYDDAHLRRRLMDEMISDPNFADLTEELQSLKASILTREEERAEAEKVRKEQEPELQELDASVRMATHESIQDLINDPDLADARAELLELQDAMPDSDDPESPEFEAALQKVEEKLGGNPAFMKRLAALEEQEGGSLNELGNELEAFDENAPVQSPEDLDKLLIQMKDLMSAMGADKQLEAELDAVIKEDPYAEAEGDFEREMDFEELSQELTSLAQSHAAKEASRKPGEDAEKVDAELEAKVDKIMEDPKLMEKLVYIQNLIAQEQMKAADITNIAHETAPDPLTMEASHLTSIQQRMQIAQGDPEHIAALRRLRVNLLPPFNISPALKSFNQAIELAYLGANDDIRRILWRAYSKARTLPTFIQNLSDDAWDLLYYSQAVTWGGNQNRRNHLKTLLQDLRSVGRNGPPTHPGTLVRDKDAEHLEE